MAATNELKRHTLQAVAFFAIRLQRSSQAQRPSKLHGLLTAKLASLQEATTEGTEDETVALWGAITGLFTACPDGCEDGGSIGASPSLVF